MARHVPNSYIKDAPLLPKIPLLKNKKKEMRDRNAMSIQQQGPLKIGIILPLKMWLGLLNVV